jgi:hypothetical protein
LTVEIWEQFARGFKNVFAEEVRRLRVHNQHIDFRLRGIFLAAFLLDDHRWHETVPRELFNLEHIKGLLGWLRLISRFNGERLL